MGNGRPLWWWQFWAIEEEWTGNTDLPPIDWDEINEEYSYERKENENVKRRS